MRTILLRTIREHCVIRFVPDINDLNPVEGFRYTATQGYLITNKRTGDHKVFTGSLRELVLEVSKLLIPWLAYYFKDCAKRRREIKLSKMQRDYSRTINLTNTRKL